jgi:hypothetical protein
MERAVYRGFSQKGKAAGFRCRSVAALLLVEDLKAMP